MMIGSSSQVDLVIWYSQNGTLHIHKGFQDGKIRFGLSIHGREYDLNKYCAIPSVCFELCQDSWEQCLLVILGYNKSLVERLVRHGAPVEHGPEIYGVYLCNNLDKVNRDNNSTSLALGVDSAFQYFDVEAATANWRGAVRPNLSFDCNQI